VASAVQFVITGIEMGSYIAISAIAFTLIYGLVNMLHIAHAEYMVVGGYLGFVTLGVLGLPLLVALPVVLVGSAVFGWVVARVFYFPIEDAGPIPLLFTSVAVGFVLRFGIQVVASAESRFFRAGLSEIYRFDAVGVQVSQQTLLIVATAVLAFAGLHLLLTRTTIGTAMRAMSADRELARITGIDTDAVRTYVWLLSSALAGLAGFLISLKLWAGPNVGIGQLLIVITAAILGGAGSPYGAIIGSYVIGIVISVSTGVVLPDWGTGLGTSVAFVVLIVLLLIRPGGITGEDITARREEV
jgi:branched-subunit amino acid ABC-type transport system permease component